MLLLSLFWSVSNDFQTVNPLRCVLCFTGQPLLFVAMKGLKISDSKGDYKNSSQKCHEESGATFYFHVTKNQDLKRLFKNSGHSSKDSTL